MLGVASEVKAYSPHILREKTKVPEEHENTNKLYYGTWQEIDPHICLRQDNIKKKKKNVEVQRSGCNYAGAAKVLVD